MSATSLINNQREVKTRFLTANLISARSEWTQIIDAFSELKLHDPRIHSPTFFLASVSPESWDPTFVVVRDEKRKTIGLLYAKERKILGVKSGLFFADATLGSLIASEHCNEQGVLEAALSALIRGGRVRGLRLFTPPAGYEVEVLGLLAKTNNFEFQTAPIERHATLQLAPTYEEFLERLSYKTRRNFRYFRKRSKEAGHVYVENISLEENISSIRALEAECSQGVSEEALQRSIEILRAAPKPLLLALKSDDGELLSFVGGWHEGDRTVIIIQLNSDKRYSKYSLSLVMRTYLIESLINDGCKELFWLGGVGEPLRGYCVSVPTSVVCLDSPGVFWRMGRRFISAIRHKLPDRVRVQAELAMPHELSDPRS